MCDHRVRVVRRSAWRTACSASAVTMDERRENAPSFLSRSLPHAWAVFWRLLATLAALEFSYLTLANLTLLTPLLQKLATSGDIMVRYDWAYSLWPGRVVVRNLRFRVQDHNIQFLVAIERGSLDVSLLELVTKHFHALRVDADNVSYRMRHKVSRVGKEGPRLAAYPPIEGFSDPPLFEGPPSPPISDADYNLWDVRIEGVNAHLKEVWILEYRYRGPGLARGNFHVKPARWYEVYPASLELEGGELMLGDVVVARRAYALIDCKVDGSDAQKLSGMEPFQKIHGAVRGRFEGTDLAFLDAYLEPHAGLSATGHAEITIEARLERGVVAPGTKLELKSANASFGNEHWRVKGASSYRLTVPPDQPGAPIELGVQAERLTVEGSRGKHSPPSLEHLDARLAVTPDVTQSLDVVSANVAPLTLNLPDLGWISGLDDELPRLAGNGKLELEGRRDGDGRWQGSAEARANSLDFKLKKFDLHGDLRAETHVVSSPDQESFSFSRSRVDLWQAQLASDGHTTAPSSVSVASDDLVLRPNDDSKRVTGTVTAHADDARALLPLVVDSPVMRRIEGALLGLHAFDAKAAFRMGEVSRVDLVRAQAGIAKAHGAVTLTKQGPTGAFLVSTGVANLGVRLNSGETRVDLFVGNDWLEKQLSGRSR